jgi:lipopolysaccharide transport system permease protein
VTWSAPPGDLGPEWVVRRPGASSPWRELGRTLRHGELLLFLGWRDLRVKYAQMLAGIAWAVLQPLIQMTLFTVVFGRLAALPTEGGTPYPVFVLAALLPWQYFATSLARGLTCLSANRELLRKVEFPRLVLPLAALLPGVVDFGMSLGILLCLMAWLGVPVGWTAILAPVFLVPSMATTLALTLWLAPLNARFRDVGYVVPVLVQAWLLLTPVAYSATLVPARYRALYELNPMAATVQGMRWSLLGAEAPGLSHGAALLLVAAVLAGGLWHFHHAQRTLVDVL